MFFQQKDPDYSRGPEAAGQRRSCRPEFQTVFNIAKGSIPARMDVDLSSGFNPCQQQSQADLKASIEAGTLVRSMAHNMTVLQKYRGAMMDIDHRVREHARHDRRRSGQPDGRRGRSADVTTPDSRPRRLRAPADPGSMPGQRMTAHAPHATGPGSARLARALDADPACWCRRLVCRASSMSSCFTLLDASTSRCRNSTLLPTYAFRGLRELCRAVGQPALERRLLQPVLLSALLRRRSRWPSGCCSRS